MATHTFPGAYVSDFQAMPCVLETPEQTLRDCPIIAVVNRFPMLSEALSSPPKAVCLGSGNPLVLPAAIAALRERGKVCLINMDTIDGLARDRHAVEFLAANHATGIVSTRLEVLRSAQSLGLCTVLRTFGIDEAAVQSVIRSVRDFCPDAVEVMPALAAPKIARELRAHYPGLHVIGGGLLSTVLEIENILQMDVDSVSASDQRLWVA